MKNYLLFLLSVFIFAGCMPGKSNLAININKKKESVSTPASISSVQIINNQLVIHGAGLENVSNVKVSGHSLSENFSIESQAANKIIANSIRAFSFDVSKVFSLVLSDANASATFQIDFSLCNATLGGAGFDCTAPTNNDVLTYDQSSNTWMPRPLAGIAYKGTWDANTAEPVSTAAGQYYIVNVANPPTYNIGDWIVWDGSSYDVVAQSAAGGVSTAFGRTGAVVALEGDYNLDKLLDVDLTTPPTLGQVLKYDGTKWIADDEAGGPGGAGSVTTTELADGSVTDAKIVGMATSKLTGSITSAQITDGAIVNADINAAAAIDYSKLNIPNTTIPYAKLNIADGDIPAAKISGLPAATSVLATTIVNGDTTHSPDGNAVFDALGLKLNLTGGTLSVGTISGVPTPTNDDDVANKEYVDSYGQWIKSGSDVYRSAGKVGVGTTTPQTALDVAGAVRLSDDATACTGTNAGAIRYNSTLSLFEKCNGTQWFAESSGVPIPANTVVLMKSCDAGWTDNGALLAGQGNAHCDGVNCHMCQSPASPSLIPASSIVLMESCPANWTSLGASSGGPQAGGKHNVAYQSCQAPATEVAIPQASRIMSVTCPANWTDLGETDDGPLNVICAGGLSCKVCEAPSGNVGNNRLLYGGTAGSTGNGGNVSVRGGGGGTTSGPGGSVSITGGAPVDGIGGGIALIAGNAATTTATARLGGNILLTAGAGVSGGTGGSITINSGTSDSGTQGHIILNNTNTATFVGVGTTTPQIKFDVNGAIRVGADLTACSATIAGAIRFNTPNVEFCNGTNWTAFSAGGALDATLTSLAGFNTNGMMVQTAADTFTARSIAGTSNRVTVTNGDAIAGNPTVDISSTLLPSPVGGDAGKFLKATGADTSAWTALGLSDVTTALGFTPINIAGDSITTGTFTLSGTAVLRSPDPVGLTDVANKQYVDSYGQWTKSGSDIYRSAGKVGIGTSSPENNLSVYQANATASLGVTSDNTSSTTDRYPSVNISNYDGNTTTGAVGNPSLNLINYRGNSSTSAVMKLGDPLGAVVFAGSSNTSSSYIEGAAIWGFASQNFTSSAGGSELHFYTTTNNTNTPTAKMVVMHDGKVGVGTTTPSGAFHVASRATPVVIQRADNDNSPAEIKFVKSRGTIASPTAVLANDRLLGIYGDGFHSASNSSTNASGIQMWAAENFTSTAHGTYMDFGTTPVGTTTRQRRMIIEEDGNVGIGTDNPSVKLEVSGDVLSASLTTGAINSSSVVTSQLGVSGAVSGYPNTSIRNTSVTGVSGTIYNDNTNTGRAFIGHINADVPAPYPAGTFAMMGVGTALTFGMDANEVMRVHTDGRVGIGTIAPGYKFDVQGGGVNASGGYTQTSDIRLKTNIDYLDSQSALEKIVSLNGIFYDWKDQDKLGNERQVGLIAQDVEKVFPEAVKKNEEGLLSVSYSNLVAPVIEAIKELNKRVMDLFGQTTKHSREIASIKNENVLKDEKIKKLERENREMKARLDKIEKMLK